MRHSQGGHTSREGSYVGVTETFNQVIAVEELEQHWMGNKEATHQITVEAGASNGACQIAMKRQALWSVPASHLRLTLLILWVISMSLAHLITMH